GSGEGFSRCRPYDISAAPHFISTSLDFSRALNRRDASTTSQQRFAHARITCERIALDFGPFRMTTVDFASHRPSQLHTSRSGEAQHFRTLASPRYTIACDFDRLLAFSGPSPSVALATRAQAKLSRVSAAYFDVGNRIDTVAFDGNHTCRGRELIDCVPLAHNPRFRLLASRIVSPLPQHAPTTLALLYTGPHRTAGGVGTRTIRYYLAFAARVFNAVVVLFGRLASLWVRISVPRRLAFGPGCDGRSHECSYDTLRLFRHLHLVWTFLAPSSRRAARFAREATYTLMFVASDNLEWLDFDFSKTSKAPHACGGHDLQHCDGTLVLLSIARRRHGTWCMADVSARWHALPVQQFASPPRSFGSPVRATRPVDTLRTTACPARRQFAPYDYSDTPPR
ncbi:hypothetical protein EXIGLDRAFT_763283, partial [Exidia glandulosa HHB12029]